MKDIIVVMITLVIIAFSSFRIGYYQNRAETAQLFNNCIMRGIESYDKFDMHTYYSHGKGEMKNLFVHAEAYTEKVWARCFRKEFLK